MSIVLSVSWNPFGKEDYHALIWDVLSVFDFKRVAEGLEARNGIETPGGTG